MLNEIFQNDLIISSNFKMSRFKQKLLAIGCKNTKILHSYFVYEGVRCTNKLLYSGITLERVTLSLFKCNEEVCILI